MRRGERGDTQFAHHTISNNSTHCTAHTYTPVALTGCYSYRQSIKTRYVHMYTRIAQLCKQRRCTTNRPRVAKQLENTRNRTINTRARKEGTVARYGPNNMATGYYSHSAFIISFCTRVERHTRTISLPNPHAPVTINTLNTLTHT